MQTTVCTALFTTLEDEQRGPCSADPSPIESGRKTFGYVPAPLLNPFLDALSTLGYTLNLDLSRFGMPRDPFGSIMITNLGSMGMNEAYVSCVARTSLV